MVSSHEKVTIACQGSYSDDVFKNMWADRQGAWGSPIYVYVNGNRVHRLYRDTWFGMRNATLSAMTQVLQGMLEANKTLKLIVVAGFSMGGGIRM